MSTQYIERFDSADDLPPVQPNALPIGAIGGAIVARAVGGGFTTLAPAGFGRRWYIDTVNGSDSNDGTSPGTPFQTITKAFTVIDSHDSIYFVGKIREQVTAPLGVYGVSIIGADTSPRHDLAASWVPPASPTAATPLLRLREQGWVLSNFLMQGHTDAAAVELRRREDATDPDASHAQFLGMRFDGGLAGIDNNGGCGFLTIAGCLFRGQVGAGGAAYRVTSTTIAVPLDVLIRGNRFLNNQSHIIGPFSYGVIDFNRFATATATVINTTDGSAQGGNTAVVNNSFNIAAADFDPAGGVTGTATDVWSNTLQDAIETGQPAN